MNSISLKNLAFIKKPFLHIASHLVLTSVLELDITGASLLNHVDTKEQVK